MNPQQLKTWRTGLYRVQSVSTAGVVGRKGFECGVPACSARRGRTVGRRTYGDRQGFHFHGRNFFLATVVLLLLKKKKLSSVLVAPDWFLMNGHHKPIILVRSMSWLSES
jgi:hypothetical protein